MHSNAYYNLGEVLSCWCLIPCRPAAHPHGARGACWAFEYACAAPAPHHGPWCVRISHVWVSTSGLSEEGTTCMRCRWHKSRAPTLMILWWGWLGGEGMRAVSPPSIALQKRSTWTTARSINTECRREQSRVLACNSYRAGGFHHHLLVCKCVGCMPFQGQHHNEFPWWHSLSSYQSPPAVSICSWKGGGCHAEDRAPKSCCLQLSSCLTHSRVSHKILSLQTMAGLPPWLLSALFTLISHWFDFCCPTMRRDEQYHAPYFCSHWGAFGKDCSSHLFPLNLVTILPSLRIGMWQEASSACIRSSRLLNSEMICTWKGMDS